MFEYHLIGNVYKDEYVVTNLIHDKSTEIFSGKPSDISNEQFPIYNNYCFTEVDKYYSPMTYHDPNNHYISYPFITIETPYKYNLDELVLDKFLNQLKSKSDCNNNRYCSKYKDIYDYKDKHKISHIKLIVNHVWEKYDEFDTIKTDREFRDNEIIKLDGKDYHSTYKFNKELNRHELHVNYDGIFEIDKKSKEKCETTVEELNFMIDKYNQDIDNTEVVIDSRFEEYQEPELPKKSLLIKFKEWIRKR